MRGSQVGNKVGMIQRPWRNTSYKLLLNGSVRYYTSQEYLLGVSLTALSELDLPISIKKKRKMPP